MRRVWAVLGGVLVVLLVAGVLAAAPAKPRAKPPAQSSAQAPAQVPAQAGPAPAEAQEKEQELARLTEEERALHKDLAKAADEIAALEKDMRAAETSLNKALDEEKRLRKQLDVLERKQEAVGRDLAALLGGLWPVHVQNLAHAGRNLDSWEEADRQFTWLARVYDVAAEGIVRLEELKAPMAEGLAAHQAVLEDARAQLKDVNAHKDELVSKKVAFDTRMAELRKDKRTAEEELRAILAAVKSVNYTLEQKLEPVPAPSVKAEEKQAKGPPREAPTPAPTTHAAKEPAAPAAKSTRLDISADLARLSVEKLKGRMPWPVAGGEVAKSFTPQANPPVRGMAMKVADGASVHAVAAGKVVHDDTLRGFGRVVILMHGDDYFSLYAYLAESKVRMGQELAMGDVVGVSGFYPEIKGPGLYFELRFHQKAINPETWLAARK
ncbi:murein hydrolase activator EnvC family protein [Megalodesulfovibrio gigas]|uniref:Putative peptidase M23 n=1 Tax=Megalodesulfovibrio gigas (strain ATCC 19364 / DSM 1382 / NCIMB 9332 / VKM B-1759) TaxID=1121448 RepID=T2GDS9_MEGG1|nr:peptidoglycan DD-metalloendopeptidase family protein [Megalodesulfovibrio gigas]AGW14458.1 putative peptidase M23 [Megalodesulfovibrio gigas DSM 1382 = ATCC 19364]